MCVLACLLVHVCVHVCVCVFERERGCIPWEILIPLLHSLIQFLALISFIIRMYHVTKKALCAI